MSGPFKFTMMLLAMGVFTVSTLTQAHAQGQKDRRNNPEARAQSNGNADRHSHMGEWLRLNHGKSLDEQKRSLENDPDFKKLPPEKQEELKQRLQKFNSLPPAQQDRILRRIDKFNRMTPQQRAQARALWDRMRLLPEERRTAIRQFFHSLVGMSPDQRQKAIGSDQFNSQFNPEERDIIQRGLQLNDQRGLQLNDETGSANENGPPQ